MKLNEIFDTETKERDVDDLSRYNYTGSKPVDSKGFGSFARVKDKKADPFLVSKIPYNAKRNLNDTDAYYCYISQIINRKIAQGNPFAPRIYKINRFKSLSGEEKYTVDMEKLIPANEIDDEDLKTYYWSLFDDSPDMSWGRWDAILADRIRLVAYSKLSKNDDLNALLQIVKNIKDRHPNFWIDIHYNNIMFRRGPYGLQVVLSDPIAP